MPCAECAKVTWLRLSRSCGGWNGPYACGSPHMPCRAWMWMRLRSAVSSPRRGLPGGSRRASHPALVGAHQSFAEGAVDSLMGVAVYEGGARRSFRRRGARCAVALEIARLKALAAPLANHVEGARAHVERRRRCAVIARDCALEGLGWNGGFRWLRWARTWAVRASATLIVIECALPALTALACRIEGWVTATLARSARNGLELRGGCRTRDGCALLAFYLLQGVAVNRR